LDWDLEASGYWYNFTAQATLFERRFAGRVETGADAISDPLMGFGARGQEHSPGIPD
jgi:phospholipase C